MRKIRTQEKETGIFVLVLALGSLCLVGNAFAQQEELDDQSVDDLIAIEQTQNPDISEPAIDILEPQIETLEPEFKTIEPVEGTGPSAPIYREEQETNPKQDINMLQSEFNTPIEPVEGTGASEKDLNQTQDTQFYKPEFKAIEPAEGTGPSAPIYLEDKELNPDTQNITEPENFDNPETMENQ